MHPKICPWGLIPSGSSNGGINQHNLLHSHPDADCSQRRHRAFVLFEVAPLQVYRPATRHNLSGILRLRGCTRCSDVHRSCWLKILMRTAYQSRSVSCRTCLPGNNRWFRIALINCIVIHITSNTMAEKLHSKALLFYLKLKHGKC